MLKILLATAILFSIGCVTVGETPVDPRAEEVKAKNKIVQKKFNNALALLDSAQYNKAGIEFKKILQDHPTTQYELMIIYNLGGALEGLGKCELSSIRYREVINKSMGRQEKLEAQALLRLSYVYECLGDDAKVIGSLLSVIKKGDMLPPSVSNAEVPARLAAAYARQGNRSQAKSYFVKAQDGLKRLNSKIRNPKKKKEMLAKTLYYMGSMEKLDIGKLTPELYLESLTYLQNYLLMSVEIDHIEWSPKSAKEILNAYATFYKYAMSEEVPSAPEAKRKHKQRASKQFEQALVSVYNLSQQRIPDEKEPKVVTQLFQQLSLYEKRMKSELSKLTNGNELTPEALKRQSLRQPGRVMSKKSIKKTRN